MSEYKTYLSHNDDELRKQERAGGAMWLLAVEALEYNMCKYIYLQVCSCISNYYISQHSPPTCILVRMHTQHLRELFMLWSHQ